MNVTIIIFPLLLFIGQFLLFIGWNRDQRQTVFLIDNLIPHSHFVVEVARKVPNQIAIIIRSIFKLMIEDLNGNTVGMFEQSIEQRAVGVPA